MPELADSMMVMIKSACALIGCRPKVPPNSPVIFDVELMYIPGVSDDLDFEE